MCSNHRPRLAGFILLLIITIVVSGCGTMKAYPGPELPREQLAIIKEGAADFKILGRTSVIAIRAVDGLKRGHGDETIAIKPGRHNLSVQLVLLSHATGILGKILDPNTATPLTQFSFEAEAGRTYVLHGRLVSGDAVYWMEDEASKQVIAGKKPEE